MIAFVFPGQGSQHVGMGKSLAEQFDVCRETLGQADSIIGESLTSLCFGGPEEALALASILLTWPLVQYPLRMP